MTEEEENIRMFKLYSRAHPATPFKRAENLDDNLMTPATDDAMRGPGVRQHPTIHQSPLDQFGLSAPLWGREY